jgi:integrase
MKGSVFFRPSTSSKAEGKKRQGTWTYAFSVPKADGKRQVTKGGFSTRRACEAALAEALVEHGRAPGQLSEPSKMLVGQYLRDEWLPTKARLKPTTRGWYAMAIESYVQPHLGHVRLSELTPGQISKMYRALRIEGGVRKGKGGVDLHQPLTERSVHKVHVLMTSALGYALVTGRIRTNPVAMIPKDERPKQNTHDRPEMRTWTAEQARQFLRATSGDRSAPIYDLALNTGLRRGELAGLRWADVDFDNAVLRVRRNRVSISNQVHDGVPKSGRARVVDLDPATVAMLRAWRVRQLEDRLAWGEAWTDSGHVFTREDGTPVHPAAMSAKLKRLIRAAEVPVIRFHDLRHTHATLGLAAGVPVKVMQERLGHATAQITLDLYSHVIPGMGAEAAVKIAGLLRNAGA